jgi:hypothetical protein
MNSLIKDTPLFQRMTIDKTALQDTLYSLFKTFSPREVCKMLVSAAREAAEFEVDSDLSSWKHDFASRLERLSDEDDLRVLDLFISAMDCPLPKVEEESQPEVMEETRVFQRRPFDRTKTVVEEVMIVREDEVHEVSDDDPTDRYPALAWMSLGK